jgi:hypothetical protein
MSEANLGQMTWRPDDVSGQSMLYLRLKPFDKWQPYTEFPQYFLPDPEGFSLGYSTFIRLLKQKWQTVR